MDVTKLKLRCTQSINADENGKFMSGTAFFFSEGIKLAVPPTVNCNRKGDGCPTPIDALERHNNHVPVFFDKAEMDAWIARIKNDVAEAGAAYTGKVFESAAEKQAAINAALQGMASPGEAAPMTEAGVQDVDLDALFNMTVEVKKPTSQVEDEPGADDPDDEEVA